MIDELYSIIKDKQKSSPNISYTAQLFEKGIEYNSRKLGEESVEVIIASLKENKQEVVSESADLLYHLLVLWAQHNISPQEVADELKKRESQSGLEEKMARKK